MKYPCKEKFAPTMMNKIRKCSLFMDLSMDINEQACVAVVGASNKKSFSFSTDL